MPGRWAARPILSSLILRRGRRSSERGRSDAEGSRPVQETASRVYTRGTCFPTEESLPTLGRQVVCQKSRPACTHGTRFLTEGTLAAVRLPESPSRVYTRGAISDHDRCNEAAPTAVMCLLPTALSESTSRVYTQDEVSDSGKGRPTGTCEHSSHLYFERRPHKPPPSLSSH